MLKRKVLNLFRTFQFFVRYLTNISRPSIGTNFRFGFFLGFGSGSWILDFEISSIDQGVRVFQDVDFFDFSGFWISGSFLDLDWFSSEIGFGFSLDFFIHSFSHGFFSDIGCAPCIDQLNNTNIPRTGYWCKRENARLSRYGIYAGNRKITNRVFVLLPYFLGHIINYPIL